MQSHIYNTPSYVSCVNLTELCTAYFLQNFAKRKGGRPIREMSAKIHIIKRGCPRTFWPRIFCRVSIERFPGNLAPTSIRSLPHRGYPLLSLLSTPACARGAPIRSRCGERADTNAFVDVVAMGEGSGYSGQAGLGMCLH